MSDERVAKIPADATMVQDRDNERWDRTGRDAWRLHGSNDILTTAELEESYGGFLVLTRGDTIGTGPDKDGDALQITRSTVFDRFTFKVTNANGDFHMTYVSHEDAVALARWILQGEA